MEGMAPTNRSGSIPDEAALMARMQAGEGDGFDVCVRAYCGQLLAVARRILKSEEDAQDAVQETFLSAFKA
jgi:RNA polymerase sigma-70 factor, ECF subfamily